MREVSLTKKQLAQMQANLSAVTEKPVKPPKNAVQYDLSDTGPNALTTIENPTHRVKRGLPYIGNPPVGSLAVVEADGGMYQVRVCRSDGGGDALFTMTPGQVEMYLKEVKR